MSKSGHGYVTCEWGDGVHTFRLGWGGWKEIEDKCKCGPAEIFDRLLSRKWFSNYVYEIIRLGLIGGGMSPVDALKTADVYVKERPLLESVPIAIEIVSASLLGPPEEEKLGEASVVEHQESRSVSPPSMETAQ